MANKSLPLKEISIETLYNSTTALTYEVPIYQRNYAWEKDEIATLVQDVYDAYTQDANCTYFIGTLVTFHKGDNVYEVIDGQQRLTTINLLLQALGKKFSNKLTYTARKKSDETIKNIHTVAAENVDTGILNGFKYATAAISEVIPHDQLKSFISFFLHNVHIIHYQVPKDIDLNHYFEIMNSRGEQLEKHEIVKARLMGILQNADDRAKFNAIWENCSDMAVYIQTKWTQNQEKIFGKNHCHFLLKSDAEDLFTQIPTINNTERPLTLYDLIHNGSKSNPVPPGKNSEKPDTFQPIIDFPNFLLIVLKLTLLREDRNFSPTDFNLDDKELLNAFAEMVAKRDSVQVKRFAFNLLKAKYLLDNFIVHHANEEDAGSNPWKLQYWYKKDDKYSYLINRAEDETIQFPLVQLLSMFEVSFTAKQRKNYLLYCLLYLFDAYDYSSDPGDKLTGYKAFLETLADKYFYDVYLVPEKLNNINVPKPGSFDEALLSKNSLNKTITEKKSIDDFYRIYGDGSSISKGIPLFIFNYLDYKLWKGYFEKLRSEKYNKYSEQRIAFFRKLGCSDFGLKDFEQFYFSRTRRSLEHYFPQANVREDLITESQINCLGNYAMIGSEANSTGSNWSPTAKIVQYLDVDSGKVKQISVASLKFLVMMRLCKDSDRWLFQEINYHQERMLDCMFNGF